MNRCYQWVFLLTSWVGGSQVVVDGQMKSSRVSESLSELKERLEIAESKESINELRFSQEITQNQFLKTALSGSFFSSKSNQKLFTESSCGM
jgi:hypothetical protein